MVPDPCSIIGYRGGKITDEQMEYPETVTKTHASVSEILIWEAGHYVVTATKNKIKKQIEHKPNTIWGSALTESTLTALINMHSIICLIYLCN